MTKPEAVLPLAALVARTMHIKEQRIAGLGLLSLLDEIVWHIGIRLKILGQVPVAGVTRLIGGKRSNQFLLAVAVDRLTPTTPHRSTHLLDVGKFYSLTVTVFTLHALQSVCKILFYFSGLTF